MILGAVSFPITTWLFYRDPVLTAMAGQGGGSCFHAPLEYSDASCTARKINSLLRAKRRSKHRLTERRSNMKVFVLGTGGWGIALAMLLHQNGQ